MSDAQRLQGDQYAFSRPEVIVALTHLRRVRDRLHEFLVPGEEAGDEAPDLGLGRLRLRPDKLGAAQQRFREYDQKNATPKDSGDAWVLDSLLRGLRGSFQSEYAGWTPLIGKNRVVGSVIGGGGKVSHGGGGPLRLAGGRSLPDRAALDPVHRELGTGVRVGVLDTAIAPNSWYAGAWTAPPDHVLHVAGDGPPLPEAGHATFVAGLILAHAPGCTIASRGVLDHGGEADAWDVAQEIVRLARTKPHVMNLSFACFTEDGESPLVLAAAIDRVDAETVIVAAAGNHGDVRVADLPSGAPDPTRKPAWPAAFDRVVAVGSATNADSPSSFTPVGVEWVDVWAPGEDVISTYLQVPRVDVPAGRSGTADQTDQPGPYDGFARWSGTSFAAATISGAIAARVRPGRTSAVEAWQELASAGTASRDSFDGRPVFVNPSAQRGQG